MSALDKPIKCSSGLGRILFIPTLFVAAIVLSKFGFGPLNSQWHTVVIIVAIYLIFVPFVFHNAFYVTCKAKKQLGELQREIDEYLKAHQWSFEGVSKSVGSVDHIFESFENRLRNDHFAGVAAGIFPTLGILGTFVSIAISMPNFSVETSQALEAEIGKLLGGVGTAFYASIFGIFLSLWWIFFEKSGLSRYQGMLALLRQETQGRLWSDNDLRLAEFKQREAIRSGTNTLVAGLGSHDLENELRAIHTTYATLHESVRNLSRELHQQVDRNLAQMSRNAELMEAQTRTQKEMQERATILVDALVAHSHQHNDVLKRYENLLHVQEQLQSSSQSTLETHSRILTQVQALNVDEAINALHEYSAMIHQSIQKLNHYSQSIQDAHTQQQHSTNAQMREGFELIDREVAHVIERLSEVALEITKNGSHIAASLQNKR